MRTGVAPPRGSQLLPPGLVEAFHAAHGDDPHGRSLREDHGPNGRWRRFTREQIGGRGDNLDLSWLTEDPRGAAPRRRPADAVADRIERLDASVLAAVFPVQLPRSAAPREAQEGLPPGWRWSTLQDVQLAGKPLCLGSGRPGDEPAAHGVRLVRVSDLRRGTVDDSKLRRIDRPVDRSNDRSRLHGGEVLVSVVGTIGEVAIVPHRLQGANIARSLARLVPRPEIGATWIAAWLRSPQAQARLFALARGSLQKTVNLSDLRELPVPLPPWQEHPGRVAELARWERLLNVVRELAGPWGAGARRPHGPAPAPA